LKNDLTIKIVEKNGDVNDVSNISIMEIVNKVDWSDTIWGNEKKEHIIDLFTFSKECIKKELTGDLIEISEEAASELKITEDIMKESCNLGEKMLSFNSGMLLGFRVPIIIQKQNGTESRTFFDIFLKKSLDGSLASSDVHYYRSGLSLPDEGSLGNLPVRGLFSAEDDGISEFLGDAEDPSHLKWNQTLEDLQDKYVNHYTLLRYIRNAMREIVRVLDIPVREKDYKLLNHIFSIPEAEKPKDELSDDESESDNGPDEKIQSRIREINISPISQGFIIKKVKRNVLPITVRVKVAYDVTRGSAFGTYDEHDFNLTDNTMIIDPTNCENIQTHENEITLTLIDRSSALKVSGFDPNRDLILNYNVVN